jgi:hypothetical protein
MRRCGDRGFLGGTCTAWQCVLHSCCLHALIGKCAAHSTSSVHEQLPGADQTAPRPRQGCRVAQRCYVDACCWWCIIVACIVMLGPLIVYSFGGASVNMRLCCHCYLARPRLLCCVLQGMTIAHLLACSGRAQELQQLMDVLFRMQGDGVETIRR